MTKKKKPPKRKPRLAVPVWLWVCKCGQNPESIYPSERVSGTRSAPRWTPLHQRGPFSCGPHDHDGECRGKWIKGIARPL